MSEAEEILTRFGKLLSAAGDALARDAKTLQAKTTAELMRETVGFRASMTQLEKTFAESVLFVESLTDVGKSESEPEAASDGGGA